jgi:hypothetical protein
MLRLRLGIASLCNTGLRLPQEQVNVNVQVFLFLRTMRTNIAINQQLVKQTKDLVHKLRY